MKLSDIYNSICIDSSVENKNCILFINCILLNCQQVKLGKSFGRLLIYILIIINILYERDVNFLS